MLYLTVYGISFNTLRSYCSPQNRGTEERLGEPLRHPTAGTVQSELCFFTPRTTKMLGEFSPLGVKFRGAAAPRVPLLPTPVHTEEES